VERRFGCCLSAFSEFTKCYCRNGARATLCGNPTRGLNTPVFVFFRDQALTFSLLCKAIIAVVTAKNAVRTIITDGNSGTKGVGACVVGFWVGVVIGVAVGVGLCVGVVVGAGVDV
jgi:hypothetical protein